jgi:hypothetical protein
MINLNEQISRIQSMMDLISEESNNESIIRKALKQEGFYDFEILYSNSYYSGNNPYLIHVLKMYFIDKNKDYIMSKSGNLLTTSLYFQVRNNEPYLKEMDNLPGKLLKSFPPHFYEKFFEEEGAKVLKKIAEYKGGFQRWV